MTSACIRPMTSSSERTRVTTLSLSVMTFTLITERAMVCVSNIAFDRREADEAARAAACYRELTAQLIAEAAEARLDAVCERG